MICLRAVTVPSLYTTIRWNWLNIDDDCDVLLSSVRVNWVMTVACYALDHQRWHPHAARAVNQELLRRPHLRVPLQTVVAPTLRTVFWYWCFMYNFINFGQNYRNWFSASSLLTKSTQPNMYADSSIGSISTFCTPIETSFTGSFTPIFVGMACWSDSISPVWFRFLSAKYFIYFK